MSSSSSIKEDVNISSLPYSTRPEWKDVQPIYLNEAETAVVNIAYSDTFREVFAYFRAILNSNEKSERVLQLTKDAAWLNPANYTVWQYRRAVLKELNTDLKEELKFVSEILDENPKSYQLWYHRQTIIESTGDASKELAFTNHMLRDDAKNYHAWQHRQWVVKKFGLWADELEFANRMISDDLRNNSAWNYRYFVITSTTGIAEVLDREIRLCMELIQKVPNNESAWNYLSGILEPTDSYDYEEVLGFCRQLLSNGCTAPYLYVFMIEQLQDQMGRADGAGDRQSLRERAVQLCDDVAKLDPIRDGYYQHLKREIDTLANA